MIARYDIIQKSEEWQEVRYGKIGGSSSKGLFVKSDTLLLNLLAELTEEFEPTFDGFESAEMMRGNDLEPVARKELIKYTGIEFLECGWLQSTEHDLIGISPDGITKDETACCEIKCPSAKTHVSNLLGNIVPLENIHQCIHYFTVNPKLEKLYFCSYRPESIKPMFVKELTRQSNVNIGTNSKPLMTSIEAACKMAQREVVFIGEQISEKLKQLSF
jgi:predicted phage-related endonuclease